MTLSIWEGLQLETKKNIINYLQFCVTMVDLLITDHKLVLINNIKDFSSYCIMTTK